MPRSQRLAIWCIALALSISLYLKGRVPPIEEGDAAFSRPGPGTVTVRLSGDFPSPGIYYLPRGASAVTAIKMTLPGPDAFKAVGKASTLPLESGDVVTFTRRNAKNDVISITKMRTRDRMLLGIPLHPDLMDAEDWRQLPGIGPVLSRRIVADRHKNGAFGSYEALLRVPGIGRKKLAAISRYF